MPNMAPQILQVDAANVDAVQQDLAALNVVEAQQQRDERGLARAGVADDRDGLPGLDAERDIAENPVFIVRLRGIAGKLNHTLRNSISPRGRVEADGVGRRGNR